MKQRTLTVIIRGRVAGIVEQRESGQLSFTYAHDYDGVPLSISMPIGNRTYGDKQVRPYLFGLLPDDPQVRRSVALEFGVSGNNPFALLAHVGLDCPGAIQFCLPSKAPDALGREGATEPISDEGIAARLKRGRTDAGASWLTNAERWSIGGQQSKFALRLVDGAWHMCRGSAATTHIFKCGISRLAYQALNEYLCMKLASACNLLAAEVAYREFVGEPAIIVKRYDREIRDDGSVERFHQEDFCQALGVLPENKYPEYGGPAAIDIVRMLRRTGRFEAENLNRFAAMLFFNYLIGAPDAHAKNYSLLLASGGNARLAPLYDVASVLPYLRPRETQRLAMGIGGENRLGFVTRNAIVRFADACGLPAEGCVNIMTALARMIPQRFAEVAERESHIPGVNELRERWEGPLVKLCEGTLQKL